MGNKIHHQWRNEMSDVGTCCSRDGQRQADSLLMHTITSTTDLNHLCRSWCNPAPLDGSAPNLVTLNYDKHGKPYHKWAFNTQACEQLNTWLGGFESIMRKMTGKF